MSVGWKACEQGLDRLRGGIMNRPAVGPGALTPAQWQDTFRKDALSSALSGVYVAIVGPYLGLVAARAMGIKGPLMAVMMAAPFLGNLLIPVWAHHLHGRPKLPFVYVPSLYARFLYLTLAFVQTARQFVLIVCVAQLLETVPVPAYSAVMERVYPSHLRGRLMSYARVARTVIAIAVAGVVGAVMDRYGYRPVFVAAAISGLCASAVFSRARVPPGADEVDPDSPRARIGDAWQIFRSDSNYRAFSISIFVYGTGNLLLLPLYPLFLANTLHMRYTQQGALASAYMIAMLVGFLGCGSLMDRFGSVRGVCACIALVALRPLIFAFAPSMSGLVVAAVLGGLSDAGIEIGYLNSIITFSPPERIPSYQAWLWAFTCGPGCRTGSGGELHQMYSSRRFRVLG
jgi:MFS family permease